MVMILMKLHDIINGEVSLSDVYLASPLTAP